MFAAAVERVRAEVAGLPGGPRRDDAVRGAHRRRAARVRARAGWRRWRSRPGWAGAWTPPTWSRRPSSCSPTSPRAHRGARRHAGADLRREGGGHQGRRRRVRRRSTGSRTRRAGSAPPPARRRTSCATPRRPGDLAVVRLARRLRGDASRRRDGSSAGPACACRRRPCTRCGTRRSRWPRCACCSAASTRPPSGRRWPAPPSPAACRWSRSARWCSRTARTIPTACACWRRAWPPCACRGRPSACSRSCATRTTRP